VKAALIPPAGYELTALKSKMHLVLSQELVRDPYAKVYQKTWRDGYVILDNGVAEGQVVPTSTLMNDAYFVKADEVVIPDVLRNDVETKAAVEKFFAEVSPLEGSFSYMGVVQGMNLQEFKDMAFFYETLPSVQTLGLPRHMLETLGSPSARIDFATWVFDLFKNRYRIHMLGTCPSWPKETKYIAKYAPSVRSIDSSLPYNYTYYGLELAKVKDLPTLKVKRPPHYFKETKTLPQQLLDANINTFLEWASAKPAPLG
jgi:hypothetical protein